MLIFQYLYPQLYEYQLELIILIHLIFFLIILFHNNFHPIEFIHLSSPLTQVSPKYCYITLWDSILHYCKLGNVYFFTVFCIVDNSQYYWLIGISQFSIVHWVVSVNNEILNWLQCVVAAVLGECMCSGSVRDACNMSHISLKDWNLDLMLITK